MDIIEKGADTEIGERESSDDDEMSPGSTFATFAFTLLSLFFGYGLINQLLSIGGSYIDSKALPAGLFILVISIFVYLFIFLNFKNAIKEKSVPAMLGITLLLFLFILFQSFIWFEIVVYSFWSGGAI